MSTSFASNFDKDFTEDYQKVSDDMSDMDENTVIIKFKSGWMADDFTDWLLNSGEQDFDAYLEHIHSDYSIHCDTLDGTFTGYSDREIRSNSKR